MNEQALEIAGATIRTLTQQRDEAVNVLAALNATLTQVDNGSCAICRSGQRTFDTRGWALDNCSNEECVSHRVAAVLGRRGANRHGE